MTIIIFRRIGGFNTKSFQLRSRPSLPNGGVNDGPGNNQCIDTSVWGIAADEMALNPKFFMQDATYSMMRILLQARY